VHLRRRPQRLLFAGPLLALITACGGPPPNPTTLLAQAKTTLDATPSLHFNLSSDNAAGSGALITGGSGDVRRPSSFSGTLNVVFAGLSVDVQAIGVGSQFWVRLPTSSSFQLTSPSDYGFGNPSQLMDPDHGLSTLLVQCQKPVLQSDDRLNGEQLHEVGCTLPGSLIAALLVDAHPQTPVAATFGITTSSTQVRRVVLIGPFFSTQNSTFTLVLDNYGENVTVTPPSM